VGRGASVRVPSCGGVVAAGEVALDAAVVDGAVVAVDGAVVAVDGAVVAVDGAVVGEAPPEPGWVAGVPAMVVLVNTEPLPPEPPPPELVAR